VAVVTPISVIIALSILVIDLTRPLDFWKIMIYSNPRSVIAIGVILSNAYLLAMFSWLVLTFKGQLIELGFTRFPLFTRLINLFIKVEKVIYISVALIATALGMYTGFLLSALITYPMLNNPLLPILFLFSGLSSAIAALILIAITVFKSPTDDQFVLRLHQFEKPILISEAVILFAFFIGLIFGSAAKQEAVNAAIGGGFWFGVVGVGIVLPLSLTIFTKIQTQHVRSFMISITSLTLIGVLLLRHFILYAGQLTPT
jgi:protein NrfD